MRTLRTLSLLFFIVAVTGISALEAGELSGDISLEGRVFFHDPIYPGQKKDNASLKFKPEYYHQWGNGSSFTFVPFMRVDTADKERTHMDVRELNYLYLADSWELRAGIGKVFWGVTESQHLVDIVNQTDLVEAVDGEEKLGQPMVHLSIPRDWGVIDMFVLPYFRERTFAGTRGRLRAAARVHTGGTTYESSLKEAHPDTAIRYSNTLGDWDFGVSYFHGTNREPTLVPGAGGSGEMVWVPHYEIIDQAGLDAQLVAGQNLWKLETIYRNGQAGDDFFALTGGFEYTFVGITPGGMDIGVLGEWLYDDRGVDATSGMENDIMVGARLTFNDARSTEALLGIIQDLDNRGTIFSFESSRRITDHWKVILETYFLLDPSEGDPAFPLRKDSYAQIELAYYF